MSYVTIILSTGFVLVFSCGVICVVVAVIQGLRRVLTASQDPQQLIVKGWIRHYFTKFELYGFKDAISRDRVLVELAERESDGRLCYVTAICLHLGDPARAAEFYRRAFESRGFPEEIKWHAADSFITLALFSDPKAHLQKMDEYSLQLFEAKPEDLSIQGTRGSVLIELGRIEEGKRMLEAVLEKDENLNDRAICAAYLAYVAHLERRSEDVPRYMKLAVETGAPDANPILKRFAFLLP